MDNQTLKPCPFCASENIRMEVFPVLSTNSLHDEYSCMCENCGATGPNDLGKSGAIEMWNLRRTEMPSQSKEKEKPK